MDLKTTLQNDMKSAMKAHETLKLGAIRMLISEIKKREIDKRSPLDEAEIQKIISSMLKQRGDSIEAFTKGGRMDLAEKEKEEAAFLKTYLPQQLSSEEVEKFVTDAITETGSNAPGDIGKVMKAVLSKTSGKADSKLVNELVRAKLSAK